MQNVTPAAIAALGLELAPAALFGFASERIARAPPWIGSGASGLTIGTQHCQVQPSPIPRCVVLRTRSSGRNRIPGARARILVTHFAFNSALVIVFWNQSSRSMRNFTRRQFNTTLAGTAAAAIASSSFPRVASHKWLRQVCCASRRTSSGAVLPPPIKSRARSTRTDASPPSGILFPHPRKTFRRNRRHVADNSYHLYKETCKLLKNLGATGYRFFHFVVPCLFPTEPASRTKKASPTTSASSMNCSRTTSPPTSHSSTGTLPQALPGGWQSRDTAQSLRRLRRIHFPPALRSRHSFFHHQPSSSASPTSATKAASSRRHEIA